MNIQLSDRFTYKKLLTFTLPSILSMLFTSIYGVVGGLFVSNVVGESLRKFFCRRWRNFSAPAIQ